MVLQEPSAVSADRRLGTAATTAICIAPFIVLIGLNFYAWLLLIPAVVVLAVLAAKRIVPVVVVWAFGIAALLSLVLPVVFLSSGTDTVRLTQSGGVVVLQR